MQLKAEIVRDVMLTLEKNIIINEDLETEEVELSQLRELLPDYSEPDLAYTVIKLKEADYITASIKNYDCRIAYCIIHSITYEGHEFLNSIRNENVWNDILKGVKSVGAFTLPIIRDLGTSLLKQQLSSIIS